MTLGSHWIDIMFACQSIDVWVIDVWVIGGGPAASVIFKREVQALAREYGADSEARKRALAEVAQRFDQVHTVHRAVEVGSVDYVLPLSELRHQLSLRLEHDYQSTLSNE